MRAERKITEHYKGRERTTSEFVKWYAPFLFYCIWDCGGGIVRGCGRSIDLRGRIARGVGSS